MNDKLQKFQEIVKVLDRDVPSSREVAELVATIIQVVKESKRLLEQQAEQNKKDLSKEVDESVTNALNRLLDGFNSLETKANDVIKKIKSETKLDLDKITRGLYEELKKLEESIPEEVKLSPVYDRINEVEKKIVPQKEILGEEIVNKINALPTEPEFQIEKEHIKGLVEELTRIASLPRGGGASRRVFIPHRDDLSSSCDGSNKTFYLSRAPLNDATIMVYGTDFPVILRPTIDFTIANKVLTLTSAVPAPNSGSTLICTFFS